MDFGYLKYGEVSFYGIGKGDPLSSGLVIQTKYFNKNYPATWGKFVIEDRGGIFALVAPDDEVYLFDRTKDGPEALTDTGMKLKGYMLHRLSTAHGDRLYDEGKIETYEEAWEAFERDLKGHNLPDFGQPSAKEVMAKKKEKQSLYSKKEDCQGKIPDNHGFTGGFPYGNARPLGCHPFFLRALRTRTCQRL